MMWLPWSLDHEQTLFYLITVLQSYLFYHITNSRSTWRWRNSGTFCSSILNWTINNTWITFWHNFDVLISYLCTNYEIKHYMESCTCMLVANEQCHKGKVFVMRFIISDYHSPKYTCTSSLVSPTSVNPSTEKHFTICCTMFPPLGILLPALYSCTSHRFPDTSVLKCT